MKELQEMGLQSLSQGPPGLGNATHPSILAWKIPWTAEPGGLHSMGFQSQRRQSTATILYFSWDYSADTMILVLIQVPSITENNLLT